MSDRHDRDDRNEAPVASRAGAPRVAATLAALVLAAGCTTEQLPVGSTLTISPESKVIEVIERSEEGDECAFDASNYTDIPIVLALTDAQGSPIGGADIGVYTDLAGNTTSGPPLLQLYDDRAGNENGVVDEDELISGTGDTVALVETGRFGGDRLLLLRVNLSCAYQGEVFAYVDGITATMTVEVVGEGETADDESGAGGDA